MRDCTTRGSLVNAVELENVTKTFGSVTAVDDLSLAVPEGCIYGFIGPNGSGKTTTLRMIMNIFYPDRGVIRVLGSDAVGSRIDHIGYLPEERGLYKNMKVRDVLKFYGELKSGRRVDDEVDRWLGRFDLTDWANKKVETLSKGMSQKAQFIATVVTRPPLVILDEPFTGLDPVNTDILREAVLELRENGATVIFSTHDMSVAERMCDFIFMIFKGRKVLDGTLSSIQDAYGHDTLRVRIEDGRESLDNLAGVENVRDFGRTQELRMTSDCDPQKTLAEIMSRTRVRSFEIAKPSLHDIFVRIAGPEAEERQDEHA
ncbi:MAG: ATP-binding cassette domain-containing protein [Candidatus Latescibacterota bacterium]|nr:MAG: ATP-binding cassette domain-containing protein [Candidatus Latescibacterota bacterium]